VEQRRLDAVDFDAEGAADRQGVSGLRSPGRHEHIPMGTGGEGAEQVNFGKEFEVVAHLSGTWFDEILMPLRGSSP